MQLKFILILLVQIETQSCRVWYCAPMQYRSLMQWVVVSEWVSASVVLVCVPCFMFCLWLLSCFPEHSWALLHSPEGCLLFCYHFCSRGTDTGLGRSPDSLFSTVRLSSLLLIPTKSHHGRQFLLQNSVKVYKLFKFLVIPKVRMWKCVQPVSSTQKLNANLICRGSVEVVRDGAFALFWGVHSEVSRAHWQGFSHPLVPEMLGKAE